MPVLDWSLPRKKSSLPKFYKIDVISMTDQDSFAAAMPEKPSHGTLRKIKSLNDLLDSDVDNRSSGIANSNSGEICKPLEVVPTETLRPNDQTGSTELWSDHLSQRGAKRSTGQFIVSGFSTLSRRAGGGMEVPDINMQAIRVFLRNGTHKTVRTDPNTTCKEVLQSVLKKIGLQESIIQYGLYIQYAISDGRVAEDDEIMANVNPNTWDSVTRIYLCRRAEFSSTYTRSRCVSFARDFLEMEQNTRSDSNYAYELKEFTNIQKRIQVSTHRGRMSTVAVHKSSANKDMVTNKLIVESFAECWAKANKQLNIGNDFIESGVKFKTVKTPEIIKRKMSVPIGTLNRSYTIERGKERRPALAKMFSTGSLETSSPSLRSSGIAASPLLQNVNVNSNNSNSNLLIPCRSGSMANLYRHTLAGKCDIHPFARPLEHSSSLPVIKISTINEEDNEIYSTLSISSLSQSDKSELLHKLSPYSSFSSLDLPRKDFHRDKTEALSGDSSSYQSSRSPSPTSPAYQNCLLVTSRSLPSLATNEAINTTSDILNANKQPSLEFGTNKVSEHNPLLPTKKPIRPTTLSAPPPLPPRKHAPTAYHSSTLPIKRPNVHKKSCESTSSNKQHDDREASDTIGDMPKHKGNTKLCRRRSISLSDLRSSLEKKSLKLTSMCNMEALRKATVMKIPGSKSRQVAHQKLIKQPEDYHNVSMKELMAIRAAVTSPCLHSSTGSSLITITPKLPNDGMKPPAIPKRHSSLLTSSSSDEEIILQYKRMSSDSIYSCQDIEMVLDHDKSNTASRHNDPFIGGSTSDDGTLNNMVGQNTTESTQRQEAVYAVSSGDVHDVVHSKPNYSAFTYDHLDFSSTIPNRAVPMINRQSMDYGETVVNQSLVAYAEVSQDERSSSSSANWLMSSSNSHYNKTIHFRHKEAKQDAFNKPYTILQPAIKSQYSKARPTTAVLKKPSCSHIYEDVGSDYEDIDDGDDDEDYVIMECKKASSVPPPPPLPPSFPKNTGGFKTWQQQTTHLNNKQCKVTTKPQRITVSSVVQKSINQTSEAVKSPVEPQIKIMVGKSIKTGQPLSFQDELKTKVQLRSSDDTDNAGNAPPTIHGYHHDYCNTTSNSTVSKQPDGGEATEPSELETKFQAMKSTHNIRKEMIEKTESKLATNKNTTKRIELHNYTNMTKNFMMLKEEDI